MELYIQIRDGQPYEHPILGNNFKEAFPHIDVNNLPPEFARFERLPNPEIATTYQVNVVSYQWENGVVKDVWSVREMTQEEKAQKNQEIIDNIYKALTIRKEITQTQIDSNTGVVREAWETHLQALNTWVLIDPENPRFPPAPRIAEDGSVLQVTAPGAEPDVIG
jgi:hypothetical protein